MVHAEAQRDAEAQRWTVWRGGAGVTCHYASLWLICPLIPFRSNLIAQGFQIIQISASFRASA